METINALRNTLNELCTRLEDLLRDARGNDLEPVAAASLSADIQGIADRISALIDSAGGAICEGACEAHRTDARLVLDVPGAEFPVILCESCDFASVGH